MNTVTISAALAARFKQVHELAELRDADGKLVGYFSPVPADRVHLYPSHDRPRLAVEPQAEVK